MYFSAELALWSESKIYWAIGAGLISHLGFFIQGEWDDKAPGLFIGYSLIFVSLLGANWVYNSQDACSITFAMAIAYTTTVASTMCIYRVLFHRLRAFPGPPLARLSKLWHVAQVFHSKNHQFLLRMQQSYGDFVRTGSLPQLARSARQ